MSLFQLLTVGQTLRCRNDETCRYKLTKSNWLPRFSSTGDSSISDPQSKRITPLFGAGQFGEAVPTHWTQPGRTVPKAVSLASPAAQSPDQACAPTTAFSQPVFRSASPIASGSAPSRALSHPELSLDGVKVVRNDLADADLEVRSPASADCVRSPASSRARENGAGSGWSRLAVRLFNVSWAQW